MIDYPIVETLRLDPLSTAQMIEAVVGEYLLPPPQGIYFKGKLDPVMKEGETYHQHRLIKGTKTKDSFVVSKIEELDSRMPVLNLDGEVVITPNQIPFLAYMPTLPVRGMKIIESAMQDVVSEYGSPRAQKYLTVERNSFMPTERLSYLQHFHPDYMREPELADQITGIIAGLFADVRNFCGDDHWIIHFLRLDRMTLYVEKSIDWRIIEYHRLSGTPYVS
jgi:hypothetical protein